MKASRTTAAPSAPPTPRPQARRAASILVHLEYRDPRAQSVCVAGSFNDWLPAVSEMLQVSPGRWLKELTLPPGTYEYRLVVDGEWKEDPGCEEQVTNPFGSHNSVLRVHSSTAKGKAP